MQKLKLINILIFTLTSSLFSADNHMVASMVEAQSIISDDTIEIEKNENNISIEEVIVEDNSIEELDKNQSENEDELLFEADKESNKTSALIHKNYLTFEEAIDKAKSENKVIMLAIRATGCKYCDRMEEETLSDMKVYTVLEKDFVTLYYNQDEDELPLGLTENMTPNFVFVNKNEDIIDISLGKRNPEEFIEVLEKILTQSN